MADPANTVPTDAPPDRLDRFGLLASAIAGRTIRVAPVEAGERAWTDGAAVFVDPAPVGSNQIAALAVQASLLAAGSLDPEIVRRLRRKPALAVRYLAVEGHRALAANRDVLPPRVLRLLDEDVAARVDSAAASLTFALGGEPVAEPPTSFGVVRPGPLLAAERALAESATADAGASAQPESDGAEALEDNDNGDNDGFGRLPSFMSDLVGGQGLLARLFKRMTGLSRDSEGGVTGGGVPRSARTVTRPGRPSAATGTAGALGEVAALRREGTAYPEWNVHQGRYRPGWCTVTEVDPPADTTRSIPIPSTRRLNRVLARLNSSPERLRRRMQGDDLDVDAVVEEQVELASGSSPSGTVYIESLRRKPDLAVVVLLDISGSSALPSPAGGTVHEQQRAGAVTLAAALHGLGNRVALYGFSSHGRSAVSISRVKRFDDPLDSLATRRLAGLVPGAYTRLGAVIRHGTATVAEQGGAERMLLVVVSDGLAYDHGYEGAYAEADARRALAEARRRGVGCVCVSVGAGADIVALRRVFGTAAHAALGHPDGLVRVVGPLFRDALRSARWRQTVYRRSARTKRRREILRRNL